MQDAPAVTICVDASACTGMLLRHGTGKLLCSKEVVKQFELQMCKVARNESTTDMLTHSVPGPVADGKLDDAHIETTRTTHSRNTVQREVHPSGK